MRPKDYSLIFYLLLGLGLFVVQNCGCKPQSNSSEGSRSVTQQYYNDLQGDSNRDSSEIVPRLDVHNVTNDDKTNSNESSQDSAESAVTTDEKSAEVSSEEIREAPQGLRVEIERGVDGDTLIVRYRGKRERVRLIGVDAPETVKENWPVEPFGPEASAYTKKRIEETGKVATLVSDGDEYDKYDRRLAFVYLGDETVSLNEDLARQGLGRVELQYNYSQKMKDRLQECAKFAKGEKLGIYSDAVGDVEKSASTETRRSNLPGDQVRIERVLNGDTLIAQGKVKIQLNGINAPESGERYGSEATAYVQRRVASAGGVVTLVYDGEPFDRYGRKLAFVYIGDGTASLNEELVRQGLAEPRLRFNYSQEMKNRLQDCANAAKRERLGIYSGGY